MSLATATIPVDVLLDPDLAESALDVLTGVAQMSAARPLRCERGAVLGAVHPGAVVVLTNPSASIVEILVAWGGTVMAVRQDPLGSGSWLADVVDAGASAALVNPDLDTLALTLATVLQQQGAYLVRSDCLSASSEPREAEHDAGSAVRSRLGGDAALVLLRGLGDHREAQAAAG